MKTSKRAASFFVVMFAAAMIIVSCGRGEATSEKNVPDSAINDSVPSSSENAFQNDLQPQGTPQQLDTLKDSIDRKP